MARQRRPPMNLGTLGRKMAIKCPQCGADYDVTLFAFGRRIRCDCGEWVDLTVGHQQTTEDGNQSTKTEGIPVRPTDDSNR